MMHASKKTIYRPSRVLQSYTNVHLRSEESFNTFCCNPLKYMFEDDGHDYRRVSAPHREQFNVMIVAPNITLSLLFVVLADHS